MRDRFSLPWDKAEASVAGRMNDPFPGNEHQPIAWLGGRPLYAAHFLALVFVVSMLATTLLSAFNLHGVLLWLTFQSANVLRGEVWRVFTYGLVNRPSIMFVAEMLMIVWFGHEIEKFFGRKVFFTLYAFLYLVAPLIYTAVGVWRPTQLAGESAGFALFIAFATLYPNAVLLFNFLAKWVAWVLVGIYTLEALSMRDGIGILSLWATAGSACAFILHKQGRIVVPSFALPAWISRRKVRRGGEPSGKARAAAKGDMAEVDALLDKIAQSGFSSLTAEERVRLDAARDQLRKRKRT